jgi:Uma2 family endonuclease
MEMQNEHRISINEYHEIERKSGIKYEYSDGRIYDMSGGTFEHSQIILNLKSALNAHLRGKVCQVADSGMKVLLLGSENPTYYPDITVICNPDDYRPGSTAIHYPRLIIEVLSPSTFARDRDEKFDMYHACPTVEEHVMVSSHHQEVEVYLRESAKVWNFVRYSAEDSVRLASVGLTIPMAEIYAQTELLPLGLPEAVFYPY